MQYGTRFPLTVLGDAATYRDYAAAIDKAGFAVVTQGGHLLSAPMGRFADRPPATYVGPFPEPIVLYSYQAGVTQRLAFRSSVLISPLYETALLAKQAAELSLLSGGRFHLGVGISWNPAEYQALNVDPKTRGALLDEQIVLLRRFWSEPYVTIDGRFHQVDGVGIG